MVFSGMGVLVMLAFGRTGDKIKSCGEDPCLSVRKEPGVQSPIVKPGGVIIIHTASHWVDVARALPAAALVKSV